MRLPLSKFGIAVLFVGIVSAASVNSAGAQTLEDAKDSAGFQRLWNGKDLAGWAFLNCNKDDWGIEDGILSTRPRGTRQTAWILSEEYFADFELRLEFLLTKGADSGIAIRSAGNSPSTLGVEIQLVDDSAYPKNKPQELTGALWGIVAPAKRAAKPLGEWNQLRLTVNERKLTVVINDVTVQDVDLNDLISANPRHEGLWRETGHIGLQTRVGVVKFRNVQIKPLGTQVDEPGGPTITLDPGMHTAAIQGVFFRDKGKQLVTVGDDHTVRLWEVEEKGLRQVEVIHPPGFGELVNAEVSQDGNLLAFATQCAEKGRSQWIVYVLSLPERRILRAFRSDPRAPTQLRDARLAFAADGKRFAATAWNQPIFIWDLYADTPPVKFWTGTPYCYGRLAFAPDGKRIAWVSGAANQKIGAIFDVETQKKVGELSGIRVAWSPDGKTIATNHEKAVHLHDADGKFLHTFELERPLNYAAWRSFVFSPDSKYLLVNGGMLLFDLPNKQQKAFPEKRPYIAKSYWGPFGHFAPDGKTFASAAMNADGENWILVRDAQTGNVRGQFVGRGMFAKGWRVNEARWSNDGQAVSWKDPKVTELPDRHPARKDPELQQATFHLDRLELGPTLKPDEAVSHRVLKRGALELKQPDPKKGEWNLWRDGKEIASLNKAAHTGGVAPPSIVANDRIASIAEGIVLFDGSGNLSRRFAPGYREAYSPVVLSPSPDGRLLMTYRWDRALYIWNLEQKHPLLSFYRVGEDWVIWTREGYYAATPGGERLIGWKVDSGIDKMPAYYHIDRFRKQFLRPDVIKLVVKKGSVAEALKAADAARGTETRSVKVEDLLPPRVVMTVDHSKKPTYKIKVQAEASTKDQPILSLRLKINDKTVLGNQAYSEFPGGKLKAEVEWTIELPEGEQKLNVMARGPDSVGYSLSQRVKYVDAKKQPVLHVLAVGINNYKDGSLDLQFAVPDADALAAAFEKHSKGEPFGDVKTKKLFNREATAKQIIDALVEMRRTAQARDLVVVFFACHGVMHKKEYYLLTHEADADKLDTTCLSGTSLRKELKEYKCQVLLMLDACHSAGFGAGRKLSKLGLKPATDDATRDLTDDDVGVAVMCAAMAHEKAEGAGGNGLFTRAVKEALEKKPGVPFNRYNQRLYIHHLQAYVFDEVSARSQERQHPFLSLPSIVESFPVR